MGEGFVCFTLERTESFPYQDTSVHVMNQKLNVIIYNIISILLWYDRDAWNVFVKQILC